MISAINVGGENLTVTENLFNWNNIVLRQALSNIAILKLPEIINAFVWHPSPTYTMNKINKLSGIRVLQKKNNHISFTNWYLIPSWFRLTFQSKVILFSFLLLFTALWARELGLYIGCRKYEHLGKDIYWSKHFPVKLYGGENWTLKK